MKQRYGRALSAEKTPVNPPERTRLYPLQESLSDQISTELRAACQGPPEEMMPHLNAAMDILKATINR